MVVLTLCCQCQICMFFWGGHFSLFPAPLGHQLNALNWKKIVFLSDSDRVSCLNQTRSYIALCRWYCILLDSLLHATGVKSSSWWPTKGSATFSLYCWVQRRFSDLVIRVSWVFNLKPWKGSRVTKDLLRNRCESTQSCLPRPAFSN